MIESPLLVLFLTLMSLCLVAITGMLFVTARDVRRTLSRINKMLPMCDHVLQDVSGALGETKRFLGRANTIAHQVEAVVQKTCQVALDVIEPIIVWRGRAEQFLAERFGVGNGAGLGPRRKHRR